MAQRPLQPGPASHTNQDPSMQRFQRDSEGALSAGTFSHLYAHKVRIIKTYFPPSLAATYAQPVLASDGVLEWWTSTEGLARPYAQLSHAEQNALLAAWHAQQDTLRRLQDSLSAKGLHTEAGHIGDLIAAPHTKHLYSVEGQLLITRWQQQPSQPAPIAAVAPAKPVPVAATPPARSRCRWCWLVLLLLLLLLSALWFWWRHQQPVPEPMCEAATTDPAAAATSSTPPEFVVILDTSGSMELNIKTPPGLDSAVLTAKHYGLDKVDPSLQQWLAAPLRSDVAKKSINQLIGELPSNIDVQLITFSGSTKVCRDARHWGNFPLNQRRDLHNQIQRLQFNGSTEFAASMRLAANSVDGVDRDAVVVLLVDGEDGCGENICTTAASIAQAKPRLVFNVVDISGAGLANCVADLTGGKVFTSQDTNEIQAQLSQASQEVIKNNTDAICRD